MARKNNLKDGFKAALRDGDDPNVETRVAVVLEGEQTIAWLSFGPVIVGAGQTVVIDTNLLSSFSRIDYILNFKDSPVTVTKSLKLVVQNNAGTITDTVSERLGGSIDLDVDVTDDAVDAFLEITNNEAYDVTVTFLRSITP